MVAHREREERGVVTHTKGRAGSHTGRGMVTHRKGVWSYTGRVCGDDSRHSLGILQKHQRQSSPGLLLAQGSLGVPRGLGHPGREEDSFSALA